MMAKKMSNNSLAKGRNSCQGVSGRQSSNASKNVIKNSPSTSVAYDSNSAGVVALPSNTHGPHPNLSTQIKIQDNLKVLPHYSVALSRPHDDLLPADELDAVQLEFEMLLSTVALRYRGLKSEYESFDREDKKQKKGSSGADKQSHSLNTTLESSTKRKRDDATSNKKSGKDMNRDLGHQAKLSKIKSNLSPSPVRSQHTDDISIEAVPCFQSGHSSTTQLGPDQQNSKLTFPKNYIPNKFWLSVEPYCMPITQEDIKLLDDLLEEYSGPLVPPIPELGPHYTARWASEDLRDEQDNSNRNAKANKRFANSSSTDVINMMSKGDKLIGEGITGPLTQRLVSALVEENLIQNDIIKSIASTNTIINESNDRCSENNPSSASQSNAAHIVSLLRNGVDVENRLKKELCELGILDMSDFPQERDDEVLNEIKRVRTELYAIAQCNHNELKRLHTAAKEEMKRLEIKRKLDLVDQELIESYKKVWAAKQKRCPLTKQERNEIFRLTEEQKRLSDQLESMPFPGLNSMIC